jgi:hypothetical protein
MRVKHLINGRVNNMKSNEVDQLEPNLRLKERDRKQHKISRDIEALAV